MQPHSDQLDALIMAITHNHSVPDDLRGLLEQSFSQLATQIATQQAELHHRFPRHIPGSDIPPTESVTVDPQSSGILLGVSAHSMSSEDSTNSSTTCYSSSHKKSSNKKHTKKKKIKAASILKHLMSQAKDYGLIKLTQHPSLPQHKASFINFMDDLADITQTHADLAYVLADFLTIGQPRTAQADKSPLPLSSCQMWP
jgi:hypothetical protein